MVETLVLPEMKTESDRIQSFLGKYPEGVNLPAMDIQDIMNYIPHRYPFILVDRILHHIQGKCLVGYKNVTMNEPFFQGHFPGRPLMPGVLQIEALAQLGAVMVAHLPEGKGKLAVLAGVDNFRFRRMVTPGDQLMLFGEMIRFRAPIGKAKVWAEVDQEVVLEGEIMFSLVDEESP